MKVISGISKSNGVGKRQICFDANLPLSTFVALLTALMEEGIEFAFFDHVINPNGDDPGAYFSYRPVHGRWAMTFGNHGWSGGIYMIEADVLGAQLHNLHVKGLKALDTHNVGFFAHYGQKSPAENEAMNLELAELHRRV